MENPAREDISALNPPPCESPPPTIGKEDASAEKGIRLELHAQEIEDRIQIREQRKQYAGRIFWLVAGWLGFVILFFALAGCGVLHFSDSVLITYLATTTVNTIGIFTIVAKYLFPKEHD